MTDPTRERQIREQEYVDLCVRILSDARTELYLHMRFLDISLGSLRFEADWTMEQAGTDGYRILYNPEYLCRLYRQGRARVCRLYLHMVLHCLFSHLDTRGRRAREYWDLACDIAMESILDGLHQKCVHRPSSPFRREVYLRLRQKLKVLTAEGIYQVLQEAALTQQQYERLTEEFREDSHEFWEQAPPPGLPVPRQNHWKDSREKLQTELEAMGQKERGDGEGDELLQQVRAENRERYDYRRFLRKFTVLREEVMLDEDSFDYIYYTYGMNRYGNMPLIEPLETKEVSRIEDFVIAVDTSMSCSGDLVRRFLEETCAVLEESESYFKKVNIRILQCDDQVRSDVRIENRQQLQDYMEHFVIRGMGGTDFRPVFEHVAALTRQGAFTKLKGLLYFTDGKGIYPLKKPPYDTAFVFLKDQYEDESVPPWAIKLVLDAEDMEQIADRREEPHEY